MKDFTSDADDQNKTNSSNDSSQNWSPAASSHKKSVKMSSGGGVQGSMEDALMDMLGLINYNERFAGAEPAQYRENVIQQTLTALIGQKKPNALLVGAPGVGKTRVVEEIARMIVAGDPLIPTQLQNATVCELVLSELISGSMYQGALEAKLSKVIELASNPDNDMVLFIDEAHLLNSRDPSYSKIGELLKPALARGSMRVIGATTSQEQKALHRDAALMRRFTTVIVDELTSEQTLEVLHKALPGLQEHYHHAVDVEDELLPRLVSCADDHLTSLHRPDNALTLLDRAMAAQTIKHLHRIETVKASGNLTLIAAAQQTPSLSAGFVEKTAIEMVSGSATAPLSNRERIMTALAGVRGQDAIKNEIVDLIQRRSLNLVSNHRPLSLLFAGPSGVGKTETAKVIAQAVTGQPPIIVNMTEYSTSAAQSQLLGSSPGYIGSESSQEKPFDSLESNPYRVIVLDEMEKANVEIQRTFLGALDEGRISDASGKTLDFSKAIIIMTTNAGRDEMTKKPVGFGANDPTPMSHVELVKALESSFEPELLGRITKITAFSSLDVDTYAQIVRDRYTSLRTEAITRNPRIEPLIPETIDEQVLATRVQQTYLPHQGARPANTLAQELVENAVMLGRGIV